jgi:hypothetical protein
VRLALAITDGPGVRNFVYGRFLGALRTAGVSTTIFAGVPARALREAAPKQLDGIELREMPIYRESRASHLWRKSLEVAHMKRFATHAMRMNLASGRPRGLSRGALGNHAAYLLASICSQSAGIRSLSVRHERSVRANPLTEEYRAHLRELNPDLLFVTHQRPPQSSPLVAAARSLGIPTATFIFSWDNLTSKGRIPVSYDHYLVWSDHMRSELLRFYADADADTVHVVGTPQFEPYAYSEFGWPEERFAMELGLMDGRRRICYTCGDRSIAPQDPVYLSILAEANRAGRFREPVEIVVRPSPAEEDTRFQAVMDNYPELKWAAPRWIQTRANHPEPWSQRIPSAEDLDLLKSTIQYCDVNVNVASTMTLDFAHAGRPVVNVGFGGAVAGSPYDDSTYYSLDHYRPVVELSAVRVARNEAELIAAINAYLADPDLDAAGRKRLIDMQVGVPLRGTSERIADTLLSISSLKGSRVPCPA